ncbi:MAG: Na+/H+ antiporter subunit E [Pigmentiphaga sp.]|nr:Na+/H+ antiporter subunit E [Pigmentiphaga sp.]
MTPPSNGKPLVRDDDQPRQPGSTPAARPKSGKAAAATRRRVTWRGLIHVLRVTPAWLLIAVTLLRELFKATWVTLRMVYAPRGTVHPAILAVPVDETSPVGITTFANMITLTPGTTTLDVSDDCRLLYVHALDVDDPDAAVRDIKASLETHIPKVWP